ncbi:MAG: hypothetical protein RSB67_01520, partial [Clostridia bacterium]
VVIFANSYGSLYIKMIPLLFILGAVGKITFGKPVTTTIFSIVTSTCMLYLKVGMPLIENMFFSFSVGLQVALGEVIGEYIYNIYLYYKKNKKISNKKIAKIKAITLILIAFCFAIHLYTNGNIFNYEICKSNLSKYLSNKSSDKFEIVDSKFNFFLNRSYEFKVLNKSSKITTKYTIYLKDINFVIDEYKEGLIAKNNNEFEKLIIDFINNNFDEKYKEFTFSFETTKLDQTKLNICKTVINENDNSLNEFCKEIVIFLNDIKGFSKYKQIDEVQISLSSNNQKDIYISDIDLKKYDEYLLNGEDMYHYIFNSLDTKYIDL